MYPRGIWVQSRHIFRAVARRRCRLPFEEILRRFRHENKAASAVEFALVASPFLFLVLAILQLSIFYMAQASLDAGIVATANSLRSSFTSTSPTFPSASALKTQVVTSSGGLIHNDSSLAVEIRQLVNLNSAVVPIADGTNDYGSTTSVLVIRGQSKVVTFAPFFGTLANVRSSAIIRRQGA